VTGLHGYEDALSFDLASSYVPASNATPASGEPPSPREVTGKAWQRQYTMEYCVANRTIQRPSAT
jgi:hypothetical protein